jgi:membrane protein YdbS with pleckstrin-like domain
MLTPDEEKFLVYWEANRTSESSLFKQLLPGLSFGLIMGVAILVSFVTGWYTRANMVANSQSTPVVLIIALLIIAVFCSVFYKRHKWEMNEQHFVELKIKKEKQDSLNDMQQNNRNSSPSS